MMPRLIAPMVLPRGSISREPDDERVGIDVAADDVVQLPPPKARGGEVTPSARGSCTLHGNGRAKAMVTPMGFDPSGELDHPLGVIPSAPGPQAVEGLPDAGRQECPDAARDAPQVPEVPVRPRVRRVEEETGVVLVGGRMQPPWPPPGAEHDGRGAVPSRREALLPGRGSSRRPTCGVPDRHSPEKMAPAGGVGPLGCVQGEDVLRRREAAERLEDGVTV